MSNTIDERVVSLEFDNKQFESNVETSLGTLDKLKKALKLDGAEKGLDSIQKAAGSFDMNPVVAACETVGKKFSWLEEMAIGGLRKIGEQGVTFLENKLKSVTVEPILSGFSKYEEKTQSVQTIMNSTGKSIDEVNGYLEKLEWFSDETSYSYTEMTSALSTMLSTGGDIEKVIPMLEGVANATAFAGKNNAEFQRTIRNLSQSYSSGYLNLLDWKSLENANTNSKALVESLIRAGEELGTIKKGSITFENFRDSLKKKWANTEVMERAFGEFAEMTELAYEMVNDPKSGVETAAEAYEILSETYDTVSLKAAKAAQEATTFGQAIEATQDAVSTKWGKTFETIFGNYEEAKVLWTDLANYLWEVFASPLDTQNEILAAWKEFGGRDDLFDGIKAGWNAILSIIDPIKEGFREIFPEQETDTIAATLAELTSKFKSFMESLSIGEGTADAIRRTFKGLFAIFDIGLKVFGGVVKVVTPIVAAVFKLGEAFFYVTSVVGDFASGIFHDVAEGALGIIGQLALLASKAILGLVSGITSLVAWIGKARTAMDEWLTSSGIKQRVLTALATIVTKVAGAFQLFGQTVKKSWKQLKTTPGVQKLLTQFREIKQKILEIGGFIVEWLVQKLESIAGIDIKLPGMDGMAGVIDFVAGKLADFISLLRTGAGHIGNFFKMVAEKVGGGLSAIGQFLGQGIQGIKDFFKNLKFPKLNKDFFKNFKENFSGIGEVLTAIKEPIKSFFSTIAGLGGSIGGNWDKIKQVFKDIFSDPSSPFLVTQAVNTATLATFAVGLKDFFSGIGKFAKSAGKFMKSITKSLDGLRKTLKTYQNELRADILKKIGLAMVELAAGVFILSKVDPNRLWVSVGALSVLMVVLGGVITAMSKFSSKSKETIGAFFKGFKNMGINKKSTSSDALDAIKAMIAIAASVLILAIAMKKIAEIGDMKKAGISLAIVVGLIGVLTGAFALLGVLAKKEKVDLDNVNTAAFGMIELAIAVRIIAGAMGIIGNMRPEQYEQGLWAIIAIIGMLSVFAVAVKSNGNSILAGAAGTMAIAAAIMMLVPPLAILGLLPTGLLLKGGIAVGLLMLTLGGAARLAGKGSAAGAASIIAIAAALNMLIIPVLAFALLPLEKLVQGAGAVALLAMALGVVANNLDHGDLKSAAAFAVLAVSLTALAGAVAILALLPWKGLLIAGVVLAGLMLALAGAGKIANSATLGLLALGGAMFLFGAGLLLAAKSMVPFAEGLIALAGAFVVLGEIGPLAVKGLFAVFEEFVNQMILFFPRLAGMIVNAVGVLIYAIIAAILSNAVQIVNVVILVILAVMDAIRDHMQQFTILAISILVEFIRGVAIMMPDIIDSGIQLMTAFLNGMADGLRRSNGSILAAVRNLLSAVIEFVISAIQEVLRMCGAVGGKLADELEGAKDKVRDTLAPESYEGQGEEIASSTAKGIENKTPEVEAAAVGMEEAATSPIDDILAKYSEGGMASPQAYASGLLSGSGDVFGASSLLAQDASIPMDQVVYAFEHDGKLAGSSYNEGLMSNYPDLLNNSELWKDGALSGISDVEAGAIGKDWGSEFSTNLKNGAGTAKEAGHAIAESALDGIREQEEAVTNRGFVVGDKYADGISTKNPEAKKAGSGLASNTITGIEPVKSDMWEVGNYAGQGFYRGLDGWSAKIKQKADAIARSVKEAAQKALDENSPSKAMMEIGAYATEGLAIGLMKKASLVKTAAGDVACTAKDSMQDAISKVAVVLESLDDMHPVIQPVLDLSEIKSQAGYMNSMFGNQQLTVGASANMNDIDQLMSLAAQINQNGSSNADVVNAITDLRRDVNHLGSQMERMQVRMDTGALVGALYNPLDKELGRQVKYRTRGA